MPRTALSAEKLNDIPIDQAPVISGDSNDREGVIVKAEKMPAVEWLDEIRFMNEPVTIFIHPSTERNAPTYFQSIVNGEWAEVRQPDGRWVKMQEGFLPVGRRITTKRKYLENILRAKVDIVNVDGTSGYDVDNGQANRIRRVTSQVNGVDIIDHGPDPARSQRWAEECRRRYL